MALVIPSVNRPDSLQVALRSVQRHALDLDELVVVARTDDVETQDVVRRSDATLVLVEEPGLAQAMRAGADACSADVVAFTDDDAELTPGWLSRLKQAYLRPGVGAVGGRDTQSDGDKAQSGGDEVGRIRWWGQVVGGHHLAEGEPRAVDHLKGVSCSYLRSAFLAVETADLVAGRGAQARNELVTCLAVKALGYQIFLEPELEVIHTPASRGAGDLRTPSPEKVYEAVHNEVLAFFLSRHPVRWANVSALCLLGYKSAPGLARLATGVDAALVRATLRGARDGARVGRRNRSRVAAAHRALGAGT